MSSLLVTGGLGFIGSALLRYLDPRPENVVCADARTYAADERRLTNNPQQDIRVEELDICSPEFRHFVKSERPTYIVHLAAESHVTRSERAAESFFRTNVEGTRNVLLAAEESEVELTLHISTDEVYGAATGAPFSEDQKEPGEGRATSPYARSKAIADDLARSFADRIPVIVVRPTNCYGPWQHPEKAVARWSTRALSRGKLPVWGDGQQIRDWMHVRDACSAIELLLREGEAGEVYNVAQEGEGLTNLEIARTIAAAAGSDPDEDVYLTEYDRPNHDRRYAVDSSKLRKLGWRPEIDLQVGLVDTVRWYAEHASWWAPLLAESEGIYKDEKGVGPLVERPN